LLHYPYSLPIYIDKLAIFDASREPNQGVRGWSFLTLSATSVERSVVPFTAEVTILEKQGSSRVRAGVDEGVVTVLDLNNQDAATKEVYLYGLVLTDVGDRSKGNFHRISYQDDYFWSGTR